MLTFLHCAARLSLYRPQTYRPFASASLRGCMPMLALPLPIKSIRRIPLTALRGLKTSVPILKDPLLDDRETIRLKDLDNARIHDKPFFIKKKDPTLSEPELRTDINKAYFPGKVYRSTSRDVVFRAMAGNTAITMLKLLAWLKTGSSAMLSEAIHSLVDTGNQAILILGLKQASGVPDKKHQYGYGRAAYFWSLISALGIFWLGSGATVFNGIQSILEPPKELVLSWEIWCVLAASFTIDGWVLKRSVQDLLATKPKNLSFYQHVKRIKDPFMMAVLYEDMAACTGVLMAGCGIGASHITENPLWDSIASISIGLLLGGVAVSLIRLNQKFLLGQSVEPDIENGIRELLLARPSIDNVYAVQSQWVGPSTFSYKVRNGTNYKDEHAYCDTIKLNGHWVLRQKLTLTAHF